MEGQAGASLVTFTVGDQEYAVDSSRVREITGRHPLTRVPHAPASLPGVMNLRGGVVPVMDLARCLSMEASGSGPEQNILIVEVAHPEGDWQLGLLVREVLDVREAGSGRPQPVPELGGRAAVFTAGLLRTGEGNTLRLLDLEALVRHLDEPKEDRHA